MVPYVSPRGVLYQHHKGPYPIPKQGGFCGRDKQEVFFCLFVCIINIVSSFVIRHISVSDSVSEQLLVLKLIVSFYFKSCPKNRK